MSIDDLEWPSRQSARILASFSIASFVDQKLSVGVRLVSARSRMMTSFRFAR